MHLLEIICYITLACGNTTAQRAPAASPVLITANRNAQPPVQNRIPVPAAKRISEPANQPNPVPLPVAAVNKPNPVPLPVAVANRNSANGDGRKRETMTYPTRYDYIDVEAVLNNDRIIKVLFNCVMNRGPCTREGLELKRVIPDAIQTECSKCTDRQRKQAGKVLAYLLTYKADYWKMLVQKFDPNNIYLKKYMADDDNSDDNKFLQSLNNDTSTVKK